jgi:Family of unknown function (DUF6155)
MKNIGIGALKQYLKTCPRQELINHIADLFTKFDSVRDYYEARLSPEDDAAVREKYKEVIKNEFFPKRGFGDARLSVARKAVSDYKKVSKSKEGLADIMLYYVETGVEFTTAYGDIDEPFYNSMESMYKRAAEFIVEHELRDVFERRCRRIVAATSDMGWGFHDGLSDLYEEYFGSLAD